MNRRFNPSPRMARYRAFAGFILAQLALVFFLSVVAEQAEAQVACTDPQDCYLQGQYNAYRKKQQDDEKEKRAREQQARDAQEKAQEQRENERWIEEANRRDRERERAERMRASDEAERRLADARTGDEVRFGIRGYQGLLYDGLPRTRPDAPAGAASDPSPWRSFLSGGTKSIDVPVLYVAGELKANAAKYKVTERELTDYGAPVGLFFWDYAEVLSTYRGHPEVTGWLPLPHPEDLRALAIAILYTGYRDYGSADCAWVLREILTKRRDVIPARVNVAAWEKDIPARAPPSVTPSLDRARFGAGGLATYWAGLRALGERETREFNENHGVFVVTVPPFSASAAPAALPSVDDSARMSRDWFDVKKSQARTAERILARAQMHWRDAGLRYDPWSRLPEKLESSLIAEARAAIPALEREMVAAQVSSTQMENLERLKSAAAGSGCRPGAATDCMPLLDAAGRLFDFDANRQTILRNLATVECHAHRSARPCVTAGSLYGLKYGSDAQSRARRLAYYAIFCGLSQGESVRDGWPKCSFIADEVLAGEYGPPDFALAYDLYALACVRDDYGRCNEWFDTVDRARRNADAQRDKPAVVSAARTSRPASPPASPPSTVAAGEPGCSALTGHGPRPPDTKALARDLALREQCRSLADAVSAAHRLFATQPEYRGAIVLWLTGARRTAADTRQVLPVWKELLAVPNWIPDNYARPLADAAVQFDRAGEHSEALAMYERFFASTLSWATPGTDQIDDYNGIRRALGMPPVDESFVKRKGWTSEPRKP